MIRVKAAPGLLVPMEGAPRRYIDDKTAAEVESSAFYRRRLADKTLVLADQAEEGESDGQP